MMSIKECPAPIQYKWKANDVCLNGLNCQEEVKVPYRLINTRIKMYKKKACKCPSKHSIRCSGNKYCARDVRACDESRFNQSSVKIKSCENDLAID